MSDNNTDNTATGNGNMDNTATGETSTVHVPLPPCYGRKTKDPSKIKTPQNVCLLLQNLQQVTPFLMIMLL